MAIPFFCKKFLDTFKKQKFGRKKVIPPLRIVFWCENSSETQKDPLATFFFGDKKKMFSTFFPTPSSTAHQKFCAQPLGSSRKLQKHQKLSEITKGLLLFLRYCELWDKMFPLFFGGTHSFMVHGKMTSVNFELFSAGFSSVLLHNFSKSKLVRSVARFFFFQSLQMSRKTHVADLLAAFLWAICNVTADR